ncbi:MAG TPA: hypothetical protein VFR52_09275 [Sphingomicrobium sp.]|nr:hypothetical protein [Sphingomicrobium sp.]
MAAAFFRFVMLVALSLMPFSMSGAMAAPVQTAAKSGGHCDEHQKPADAPSAPKAHCAACAALPAGDAPVAVAELRPALLLEVEPERWITEREPDIDTPPPKLG